MKKGNKAQEPKAKSKPGKAAKVPVAKAKKSVKKQKKKQIVAKKPAALSFSKKDKELKVVKEVVNTSNRPKNYQDYQVVEKPRVTDIYRNTYTSRHYWKARTLAKRAGFSDDEAKLKGKQAIQEASRLWDDVHPN